MEEIRHGKPKKKVWRILLIVLVLCLAGGATYYKIQQDAKEKELYAKVLGLSGPDMKAEVVFSELLIEDYSKVWSNAINRGNDFSEAIYEFQNGEYAQKILVGLDEGEERIKENMRYLKNSPEEYKESYEILKEMYSVYTQLLEQAQSPSGSLIEFNRKTNEYYEEYLKLEKEFYISVPKEIEGYKTEFMEMEWTRKDLGVF